MSEKVTRVAVVTGGNRGIGLEICRQLAQRGDLRVVLASRDAAKGTISGARSMMAACDGSERALR